MLVPRSPLSFQTLYKWEEKGSTKRVHLQRWLFAHPVSFSFGPQNTTRLGGDGWLFTFSVKQPSFKT